MQCESCGIGQGKIQKIQEGFKVVKFSEAVPSEFTLSEVFHVKLDNGESLEVALKEESVIKALYMDVEFHKQWDKNFAWFLTLCIQKLEQRLLWSLSTELMSNKRCMLVRVSKSLVHVQRLTGASPSKSAVRLTEMAKIYLHVDKESGLPKHNVPVYKNFKSNKNALSISKVVYRIKSTEPQLPFLL